MAGRAHPPGRRFRSPSPELEIDIGADAFTKALAALPPSGTVLPFVRRAFIVNNTA